MRIAALRAGAIAPGAVLRWRLADPDVVAEAPEHPAPPSANQASRLDSALARRAAGDRHPRWLAVVTTLDGPLDVSRLTEALVRFAARHTTLRSGFRVDGGGVRRFMLPALPLEPVEAGVTATRAQTLALLGGLFDAHTDPLSWPSHCFAAVVRRDGASVVLAFDHMDTDHYSLAVAAHEIRELYHGRELAPAGDYVSFCAEETAGRVSPDEFAATVSQWREFLADGAGTMPRLPLDLGLPQGERAFLVDEAIELLDEPASAALERWCRTVGASLFSGLLAALGIATGQHPFRIVAAMQTRPDDRPSLGWYANAAPIRFGTAGGFAATVQAAHRSARAASRHCRTPIERVEAALGSSLHADEASWFSYVDFRRFPGSREFAARDVHVLAGERTGAGADLWAYRTWEGVRVTVRYPDTAAARAGVHGLVSAMRQVLLSHARRIYDS